MARVGKTPSIPTTSIFSRLPRCFEALVTICGRAKDLDVESHALDDPSDQHPLLNILVTTGTVLRCYRRHGSRCYCSLFPALSRRYIVKSRVSSSLTSRLLMLPFEMCELCAAQWIILETAQRRHQWALCCSCCPARLLSGLTACSGSSDSSSLEAMFRCRSRVEATRRTHSRTCATI